MAKIRFITKDNEYRKVGAHKLKKKLRVSLVINVILLILVIIKTFS